MHVFNPIPFLFFLLYLSTFLLLSSSHTLSLGTFLIHSLMAKLGKLTKLKSAIKRWPSFPKLSRSNSCVSSADKDLRAVYVGRSRRRYLVNSDIVEHPVFQELVERSSRASCSGEGEGIVVACEVVLFEHLLWMLESAETQLGSMDELVEFYACA